MFYAKPFFSESIITDGFAGFYGRRSALSKLCLYQNVSQKHSTFVNDTLAVSPFPLAARVPLPKLSSDVTSNMHKFKMAGSLSVKVSGSPVGDGKVS